MLLVNVSLRDGGVLFKTFSETSSQLEPRRVPHGPQTRPRWTPRRGVTDCWSPGELTSGDQTISTRAPDEAQQKEPSECKK